MQPSTSGTTTPGAAEETVTAARRAPAPSAQRPAAEPGSALARLRKDAGQRGDIDLMGDQHRYLAGFQLGEGFAQRRSAVARWSARRRRNPAPVAARPARVPSAAPCPVHGTSDCSTDVPWSGLSRAAARPSVGLAPCHAHQDCVGCCSHRGRSLAGRPAPAHSRGAGAVVPALRVTPARRHHHRPAAGLRRRVARRAPGRCHACFTAAPCQTARPRPPT